MPETIEVERSITDEDVASILASLFHQRGEPAFIRSDKGPEIIAKAIKRWLEVSGVGTLYIEPGSPQENAYSETFISRFGDVAVKERFSPTFWKAKVLVEDYRGYYNHHRPHSALGYQTPAKLAVAADLAGKGEVTGKPKELESVLTPSQHLVQKTGSAQPAYLFDRLASLAASKQSTDVQYIKIRAESLLSSKWSRGEILRELLRPCDMKVVHRVLDSNQAALNSRDLA